MPLKQIHLRRHRRCLRRSQLVSTRHYLVRGRVWTHVVSMLEAVKVTSRLRLIFKQSVSKEYGTAARDFSNNKLINPYSDFPILSEFDNLGCVTCGDNIANAMCGTCMQISKCQDCFAVFNCSHCANLTKPILIGFKRQCNDNKKFEYICPIKYNNSAIHSLFNNVLGPTDTWMKFYSSEKGKFIHNKELLTVLGRTFNKGLLPVHNAHFYRQNRR